MSKKQHKGVVAEMHDGLELNKHIDAALISDDYAAIEEILISPKYPNLTKEQKEKRILNKALVYLYANIIVTEEFFKYLIFDYKINEAIYSKMNHIYKNSMIDDMFAARKFNEELSSELVNNTEQTNKKTKV